MWGSKFVFRSVFASEFENDTGHDVAYVLCIKPGGIWT
jgi:hypothetical protein